RRRDHRAGRGRLQVHRQAALREGAVVHRGAGHRPHRSRLRLHHLPRGSTLRGRRLRPGRHQGPARRAGHGRGARLLHAHRAGADGRPRLRAARHRVEGGAERHLRPRGRAGGEPGRRPQVLRPPDRGLRPPYAVRGVDAAPRRGGQAPERQRRARPQARAHPQPGRGAGRVRVVRLGGRLRAELTSRATPGRAAARPFMAGDVRRAGYDPFARGGWQVGVRTIQAHDTARDRRFACEVWYPAARHGTYPLIVYSHPSASHRRAAASLCAHLSSHGYVVAALDHREDETAEQKIASRVPDVRFLLDHLLDGPAWDPDARLDPTRVGIVGHSFGGWTALAAPDVESRIRAVVALAPGGASQRKPGILPASLAFTWGRDLPTLYLVAEDDTYLPLAGMY